MIVRKRMVEEVVKLMQNRDRIRNIGIIAHIDHGKCISGDAQLMLNGTEPIQAEQLFHLIKHSGTRISIPWYPDAEIYLVNHLRLLSLDPSSGRFSIQPLSLGWRLKASQPLIEIVTRPGNRLCTTPEHRYLCLSREGSQIYLRADQLKPGDLVAMHSEHGLRFQKLIQVRACDQERWIYDFTLPGTRNFLANELVVHNTTLTDSLLAACGLISYKLAGQQLFMDFYELEQQRGITIDAAYVSMVHNYEGQNYLINLIDTPGHVDFGGEVTRALRAVDGVVLLVDAVEGVMPQTETVLRQALKERTRPVLFINKIDRMIRELKLDPNQMKLRLAKIIDDVNELIKSYIDFDWKVSVSQGSVAFGSALHKWGISYQSMQRTGIGFSEVYKYCESNRMEELAQLCPVHTAILDMVVRHLPNPIQAQKYRIPVLWKGDLNSEIGKAMINCDPAGPAMLAIIGINVDPHAGYVATGRIFSGRVSKGMELWLSNTERSYRVQNTGLYMGPDRIEIEESLAGNLVSMVGIEDAVIGATAAQFKTTPFEAIRHYSEPVVTVAVEPKNTQDLVKLIEVLKQMAREDATLQVEINQETGEYLISGMGELHLEVAGYRIEHDKGVPITMSKPIVIYREAIRSKAGPVEGVSPNRHNRFWIEVEPLPPQIVEKLRSGELHSKLDSDQLYKELVKLGMEREEAKNVIDIHGTNMFVDLTKGVLFLREALEFIREGFRDVMEKGPIAKEKCQGIKARLVDIKLHEDPIHRGPAQLIPAVRYAIQQGMLMANYTLLEPIQEIYINAPQELIGDVVGQIQSRRGHIMGLEGEGRIAILTARAPVAEMFGFASAIRSATQGRAFWSTQVVGFEPIPEYLLEQTIISIRKRKGMPPEVPKPEPIR